MLHHYAKDDSGKGNKSVLLGMLFVKSFKHLKIDLSEEVASELHEKSTIGKQFMERWKERMMEEKQVRAKEKQL